MTILQADSQERIARYQLLKDEAAQQGNAKLARQYGKEINDEQRNLKIIIRVESINELGELEGYMRLFSARQRSKDLVAI